MWLITTFTLNRRRFKKMKREMRLFVGKDGILTVEDPSPLEVKLLERLGIKLEENKHSTHLNKLSPRYRLLKDCQIQGLLPQNSIKLFSLHDQEIKKALLGGKNNAGNHSIFDLKRRLFRAYIKRCCLCGHKCNGHRILSGECPIGRPSHYYQHFIHVGEEKEIGRTLVIELAGCNIRCKFCQKGKLINPKKVKTVPFIPSLWDDIKREYICSDFDNISFLGGNPDQSFLAVLDFLENAPDWALNFPIIWHTNGYSSPIFYNLLHGLVDIMVFDFKYFNNICALSLSQAPLYKEIAKSALKAICGKRLFPLVIVRHLILPGHWNCCQKTLIDWLKENKMDIIFHPVSQYKPL
ncbi:MAG: 4Fe-4S cluster-binding domain-containing protein [Thermodesulfovibrionales bacterium]|nr:4Fe-4S cluster-binding domain-containing protein [Thermodesulfovibrionales bacterium]